jgi:hypothetical protein
MLLDGWEVVKFRCRYVFRLAGNEWPGGFTVRSPEKSGEGCGIDKKTLGDGGKKRLPFSLVRVRKSVFGA